MKKTLNIGYALGVGAILVACLTGGVRGQAPQAAPIITPPIDEETLAKATAKGQELLSKTKWKTDLKIIPGVLMDVVGPTLVCRGSAPETTDPKNPLYRSLVVDRGTGRVLVESPVMPTLVSPISSSLPMAWIDNGLVSFETKEGKLKSIRWSAENPTGAAVWETAYTAPPGQGRVTSLVSPTSAGKQIIAGESLRSLGAESGLGPTVPQTSLAIRSFDSKTGQLRWTTPVPGKRITADVTEVAEGKVYVLASKLIMGLNAADGKVLWTSELETTLYAGIVWGTELYTLTDNYVVTAYDGQTGKELWHLPLSKDCDPGISKLGRMRLRPALYRDDNRLLVTVNADPGPSKLTIGNVATIEGIAVLDLITGKQTGYFNDKGVLTKLPISTLQIQGDVLIAHRTDLGVLGIDRKTLHLEWYIPASKAAAADGMLYVIPEKVDKKPVKILALPLDAPR